MLHMRHAWLLVQDCHDIARSVGWFRRGGGGGEGWVVKGGEYASVFCFS